MERDFIRIVKGICESYTNPIYAIEITLSTGKGTTDDPIREFQTYYSFAKRFLGFNDSVVGNKNQFEVIEEIFLPNNINLKEYEIETIYTVEEQPTIGERETISDGNIETVKE